MSARRCRIETCQSSSDREQDRGVTFHRLPKDAALRANWIARGRLEADHKSCFVCSRHFRRADYEPVNASKFILKADAVPTIFSWGITPLEELNAAASPNENETSETNETGTLEKSEAPGESSVAKSDPVRESSDDRSPTGEKMETDASIDDAPRDDSEAEKKDEKIETERDEDVGTVSKDDDGKSDAKTEESVDEITSYLKEENRKFDLESNETDLSVQKVAKDVHSAPEIESIFENLLEKENNIGNLPKKDNSYSSSKDAEDVFFKESTEGKESIVSDNAAPNNIKNVKIKGTAGRPRRRSPLRHKNVSVKTKIAKRKNATASGANSSEKVSSAFIKCDKGTFVQGSRVEAKDFSDCWYLAKVLEVDNDEEEVLIHYDKWSQRYDEWINIHSSRLRFVEGPPPTAQLGPPTYTVGERCFARWTNNQRFPATVKKVLPNGKYEVMFDDGFIRTMKWIMMSKGTNRRVSTASSSPNALSPIPYGSRHDTAIPGAPPAPPTPLHNHLFDPKCDHLGTKEERRHLKKKIDVKSLFSVKKKRKEIDKDADLNDSSLNEDIPKKKKLKTADPNGPQEKIRKKPGPKKLIDKQNSLEVPNSSNSNISTNVLTAETSDDTKPILSPIMKPELSNNGVPTTPTSSHSKEHLSLQESKKILHNKLISKPQSNLNHNSTGTTSLKSLLSAKSNIVNSRNKKDIKFSPHSSFSTPKKNFNVNSNHVNSGIKTETENNLSSTSIANSSISDGNSTRLNEGISPSFKSTPNISRSHSSKSRMSSKFLDPYHHIRAAEKDWCCHWVNNTPVGTVVDSEELKEPFVSRHTVQVEDARLPAGWTKLLTKKVSCTSDGKWDVILICPSGRRYRNRKEMQERLKEEDFPELSKHLVGLLDFSAHRKQARRCGWDLIQPDPSQTPLPETGPPLNSSLPGVLPDAANPEEKCVYIGSLKVQIIENLLRCPQDKCFKNFRKENLLQMHIKHYHPELCKFFGDTPNVADLAYARTVVEESTPPAVKTKPDPDKPSNRSRDRKSESYQIKQEFDDMSYNTDVSSFDNSQYDHHDHTHHMKINSTNFYTGKLATDTDFKSNVKLEDPAVKVEESFYSHWNSIKQKSPNQPRESLKMIIPLSRITNSHKNHNKSYNDINRFYPSAEDDYHSIDMYKKHSKKSDHKSKKKNFNSWNNFSPAFDETRSSFGVSDRNSDNLTSNYIVNDDVNVKTEIKSNDEEDKTNQSTIITESGEKIKIVHMKREEIINCHCGFGEEDGLMIQCELCLCWQHALCNQIERESEVPNKYICYICLNPLRGRRSQKYLNDQDCLYEGRLPRASNIELPIDAPRADMLRKSHELTANLLQIKELMHSLRYKIEVAEKKDHPKLYLWSKAWEENIVPNPESVAKLEDEKTAKDPITDIANISIDMKNKIIDSVGEKLAEEIDKSMGVPKIESIDVEKIESMEVEKIESMDVEKIEPIDIEKIEAMDVEKIEAMDVEKIDVVPLLEEKDLAEALNTGEETKDKILPAPSESDFQNPIIDDLKDKKVDLVNGASQSPFGNLFASPGGTSLDLPITHSDLEALARNVPVLAPQPEAAIEPSECRLRLLQHVETTQSLLDARLDFIEAKIAEMESESPMVIDDETPDSYPRTKQTLQMLRRDLLTLEELGSIC